MSEPLTAEALRARLRGAVPAPAPDPTPDAPTPALRSNSSESGYAPPVRGLRRGAAAAEAAAPPVGDIPVERTAKRTFEPENLYAGSCAACGNWVEAKAGTREKVDGKWRPLHLGGTCPPPKAPAAAREADPVVEAVAATDQDVPPGFVKITAVTGQTYVGLQPGTYTLEIGSDGHRTFRVRVQGTEEDFAPGKTILEYLSGPDNERDFTSFAFLNGTRLAPWKRFKDGHEALLADAQAFLADPSKALLSARCIRCGRKLTTPTSVASMMGDECRNRGW